MVKFLFLSYINRSGSTLLANQLSKHPQFCVCPEADILYDLFLEQPERMYGKKTQQYLAGKIMNDPKLKAWKLPYADFPPTGNSFEIFLSILKSFQNEYFPKSEIIVYKHNYLYKLKDFLASDIKHQYFWISLLRNPFAIYASQKNTISPHTKKPMSRNPLELIDQWNAFTSNSQKSSEKNDRTLSYEDLVEHPYSFIPEITRLCEINLTPDTHGHRAGTLSKWMTNDYLNIHEQIDQPPNRNSITKWETLLTQKEKWLISYFMIENKYYNIRPWEFNSGKSFIFYQKLKIERTIHALIGKLRKLKHRRRLT